MRRVTRLACLACSALGCGRLGFTSRAANDASPKDAAMLDSAPAAGVRWQRIVTSPAQDLRGGPATGFGGGSWGYFRFDTEAAITDDVRTHTFSAPAGSFGASAVVRFDAQGNVVANTQLFAPGICDMRAAAILDSGALWVTGFTNGSGGNLGPCDVAVPRQSPITFQISSAGTVQRTIVFPASGGNSQGWSIAPLRNAGFALAAVYGGSVAVEVPLPAPGSEGALLTRVDANNNSFDSLGLTNTGNLFPGPVATSSNDDICMLGAYNQASTILGQNVTSLGAHDAYVLRVGAGNVRRFVAALQGPGEQSAYASGAVVALDDSCLVALSSAGSVRLNGVTLPVQASDAVIARIGNDGATRSFFTIGGTGNDGSNSVLALGARYFAAIEYDAPVTIAGQTLPSAASDVALVEFNDAGPTKVHTILRGAGTQRAGKLGIIDNRTLVLVAETTGELTTDTSTTSSVGTAIVIVAVDVGSS